MPEFVKVMATSELPPGQCTAVEVNGVAVALFNLDGDFYAIDHVCPHQGGPLGEGWIEGENVICPWHAWAFNIKTGESPLIPGLSVKSFPVQIESGNVKVAVD